jgi:hypothetical protein
MGKSGGKEKRETEVEDKGGTINIIVLQIGIK